MNKKDIKTTIKQYFLHHPTIKHRVRQLERELKLPLPSVIRYTNELAKEQILKRETIAGVTLFSADRSSQTYLLEKKIYNLRSLYTSGLIAYLAQELSNPTLIVFGSYGKGEDIEESDIDLYVETVSERKVNLQHFERKLKREINIIASPSLEKLPNPHLRNSILN